MIWLYCARHGDKDSKIQKFKDSRAIGGDNCQGNAHDYPGKYKRAE
jgi:hypothetical protein